LYIKNFVGSLQLDMHDLKLKSNLIKLSKNERLYHLDIPVIALTGGIACGKSTVAKLFQEQGMTVIDADQLIHQIYKKEAIFDLIKNKCPQAIHDHTIDFKILRSHFFNDPLLKADITSALYAHLPSMFTQSIPKNCKLVVYDIPLLFENNLQKSFDLVVVVYAPRVMQIERLIQRDRISKELAQKILDQQWDIEDKRQKADFVIENTHDFATLKQQVTDFTRDFLT
jgi:dephospho-CoA kinase